MLLYLFDLKDGNGGIIPMELVVLHYGVIIFIIVMEADFNHQLILKVVI
jgi:hypothetical protein